MPNQYIGSIESRFWSKVFVKGRDDCWVWNGFKDKLGYGKLTSSGKSWLAHRFSYKINVGEIPESKLVCHFCDNPSCVNPSHLFIGSDLDNSSDMMKKGRGVFLVGDKNGNSKLTKEDVVNIKNMYKIDGTSKRSLSEKYNVSLVTIYSIINNHTWRHV